MKRSSRKTKPVVPVARLVVLALILASCNNTPEVEATTTTPQTAPTTIVEDSVHPDVPPIECSPLITAHDVDVAFDKVDEFAQFQTFELRETCTTVLYEDEDLYIRIEPGDPADFEPGAIGEGLERVEVDGVGDEALWFGAEGIPVSVISVRATASFGALHYRVVLSRPDADSATHRDATRTLALAALPRFPGVVVEEPEPVLVTFEPEPFDRSQVSYEDNLLVREADGEWTRAEGLVATLRLFAGEVDPEEVLRHSELVENDGTAIIGMAREYLDTGTDEEAKAEIARLSGLLAPSIEQLLETGAIEPAPPTVAYRVVPVVYTAVESEQQDYCMETYGVDGPCMVEEPLPGLDEKYKFYRPKGDLAGFWTLTLVDWVRGGMTKAVTLYEGLGEMPGTHLLLSPYANSFSYRSEGGGCVVSLGQNVPGKEDEVSEDEVRQRVAFYLAICLIYTNLPYSTWWGTGMALYLSDVVVPGAGLEQKTHPHILREAELSTTLMERKGTNWALFEFMHTSLQAKGNFEAAPKLPSSAGAYFHLFNLELTDGEIKDVGTGTASYAPLAWDLPISGPTVIPAAPPAWGVRRIHFMVDPGMYACLEVISSGAFGHSWRPGAPGTPGSWGELPLVLSGESVLVVSATGTARYDIIVSKVVEDEDDCDEDVIDLDDPSDLDDASGCLTDLCGPSKYYFED